MKTAGHGAFLKVPIQGREETIVRNSVTPRRLVRREAAEHVETICHPPGWRLPDVLLR